MKNKNQKQNIKYIYIASPYSTGNQVTNIRNAIFAAEEISSRGFIPIVPHLSHLWDMVVPHEYEFWIVQTLELMKICDAVLRLPGKSPGADNEVAVAISIGMPVFYDIENIGKERNK